MKTKKGPLSFRYIEEFVDDNCVVLDWLIGEHWKIFFQDSLMKSHFSGIMQTQTW